MLSPTRSRGRALSSLLLVAILAITGSAVAAGPAPRPARSSSSTAKGPTQEEAYAKFKLAPKLPRTREQRNATVLTYLMTDDDHHQSPHSAAMVKSFDKVPQKDAHNVVFRDGKQVGDSKLYYLRQGKRDANGLRAASSRLAPHVTEVQSNNPKVLSEVVKWTFDNYAGGRKYLEIYTHGGGAGGIGTDTRRTAPNGQPLAESEHIMRVADFGAALRAGLKGRKLDAVYFRACLMGNIESLYEVRDSVNFAIASEQVSYSTENSNRTMSKLFQELAAKDTPPHELVRQVSIQGYGKSARTPAGQHSGYDTIMAADLSKVAGVKSSLNTLVNHMNAAMPTERDAIIAAYDAVPQFSSSSNGDLWRFTKELQTRVKDPALLKAVAGTREAQRAMMLHAKDNMGDDANGLSILMPKRDSIDKTMQVIRYGETRFAKDSNWADFLTSIAETPKPPPAPSAPATSSAASTKAPAPAPATSTSAAAKPAAST